MSCLVKEVHGRAAPAPSSRRSYVTPKRDQRAAATRTAILAAAEELFLRDGYTRTSMRAVATRAGVSEKTVYLTFSTKANLLRHVIQLAVRGDEAPAPISERPEWRAVVTGATEEVFGRFAALNARTMTRTAEIIALGESAAATDPELAEYRDRDHAATRADLCALAAEPVGAGSWAPGSAKKPSTSSTPWPPTRASSCGSPDSAAGRPSVTPTSSPAPSKQRSAQVTLSPQSVRQVRYADDRACPRASGAAANVILRAVTATRTW